MATKGLTIREEEAALLQKLAGLRRNRTERQVTEALDGGYLPLSLRLTVPNGEEGVNIALTYEEAKTLEQPIRAIVDARLAAE